MPGVLLQQSTKSSPWPWRLETDEGSEELRLLVECPQWLESLEDTSLDIAPSEVRLGIAPGLAGAGEAAGTTVVLSLPPSAPKIDTDRAKCRFARKRRTLVVSWPKEKEAQDRKAMAAGCCSPVAPTGTPADEEGLEKKTKTAEQPEAAAAGSAAFSSSSPADAQKADATPRENKSNSSLSCGMDAVAGDTASPEVTERAAPEAREPAGQTGLLLVAEEDRKSEVDEEDDPEGRDALSWKEEGNAAFKAKELQVAIRAYSKGIRAAGGSAAKTPEPAFALFSNRALCSQQLGRFEAAAADAEACVRLKPDFHKGYLRGGLALKSLNRSIEAFAFIDRAPPGLVMSNAELHDLHKELQALAAAEEERRLAEMSAPERGKTRGNVLFKKAKFEEALRAYTEGYEALGSDEERESELALNLLNNRAACHHQLSNYREVVRDTEVVLRVQPENLKARLRRMLALEPMEKYREALADARFVLARDPTNDLANKLQHRLSKVVRDMDRANEGGA